MRIWQLCLILFLFNLKAYSQKVPNALNYQAVARTSSGLIIPGQTINVRFSILDVSLTGAIVYQETQTATTNNFGLFTLAIGKGVATTGAFNTIDWASGDKFLKVELGPSNNGIYDLQGTTQLLSVPYALYAEKTKLLPGNNTITIANGNTISANYVAGTGVNITGNTISGNYQAGTGVSINGNTIAGNYLSGNGININGNTISSGFTAGNGIDLSNNTITSTTWTPDLNGIHSNTSNVGVGGNSIPSTALNVVQTSTAGASAGIVLQSADTWHTVFSMANTSLPVNRYSFSLGGNSNQEVGPGNFGILNHNLVKWSFIINGATNNVGIGMNNVKNNEVPKSKLHVFNGDVNIEQIGSGIIMKSPDGNCWRVTVGNSGNLVATSIPCL